MAFATRSRRFGKRVPQAAHDPHLMAVAATIRQLDPAGSRTARVLRDTLDQLYDGLKSGRCRWDQLYNSERNKGGHLVEINLQREFKFHDGAKLDFQIAGVDVDCTYAQTCGAWMIPPEARGHLCLVLSADDSRDPKWSMGLVRVTEDRLNIGANRDAKATLNDEGRHAITWLFDKAPLPPNVLLQLDAATVTKIMNSESGQERIDELFRSARKTLKPEGIVILGDYSSHRAIAEALGAPAPHQGESISLRLAPAQAFGPGVVRISGSLWKLAGPDDPLVPGPDLPRV